MLLIKEKVFLLNYKEMS